MYRIYKVLRNYTIETISGNQFRVSKKIKHDKTFHIKVTANVSKDGLYIFANAIIEHGLALLTSKQIFCYEYSSKSFEEAFKAFEEIVDSIKVTGGENETYDIIISGRTISWTKMTNGNINVKTSIGDSTFDDKIYHINSIIKVGDKGVILVTDTSKEKYWSEELTEI